MENMIPVRILDTREGQDPVFKTMELNTLRILGIEMVASSEYFELNTIPKSVRKEIPYRLSRVMLKGACGNTLACIVQEEPAQLKERLKEYGINGIG